MHCTCHRIAHLGYCIDLNYVGYMYTSPAPVKQAIKRGKLVFFFACPVLACLAVLGARCSACVGSGSAPHEGAQLVALAAKQGKAKAEIATSQRINDAVFS